MAGALPNTGNGGVVTRNAAGIPVTVVGVVNPLAPPAAFVSTCELTTLTSDCSANILPEQINGIVAELVNLAAALVPTGPWRCNATDNLGALFTAWSSNLFNVDNVTIQGDGSLADPFHAIVPTATVAGTAPATQENVVIPTTFFGANDARLGRPVRWIEFTIPGVAGVVTIPSYS